MVHNHVMFLGPGLVFSVYPEAFVTMPVGAAQLFSILFFFMLICLAIDSQVRLHSSLSRSRSYALLCCSLRRSRSFSPPSWTLSAPKSWASSVAKNSLCLLFVALLSFSGFPASQTYSKVVILFLIQIVLFTFIVAIQPCLQGGIYFFKIIDYYSSGLSLMLVAFFEVTAICWVYGKTACRILIDLLELISLM